LDSSLHVSSKPCSSASANGRSELFALVASSPTARPVLGKVHVGFLDLTMGITATLTITAYSLYCISPIHDPTLVDYRAAVVLLANCATRIKCWWKEKDNRRSGFSMPTNALDRRTQLADSRDLRDVRTTASNPIAGDVSPERVLHSFADGIRILTRGRMPRLLFTFLLLFLLRLRGLARGLRIPRISSVFSVVPFRPASFAKTFPRPRVVSH